MKTVAMLMRQRLREMTSIVSAALSLVWCFATLVKIPGFTDYIEGTFAGRLRYSQGVIINTSIWYRFLNDLKYDRYIIYSVI